MRPLFPVVALGLAGVLGATAHAAVLPIASIKVNDANGIAVIDHSFVTISGTVTCPDSVLSTSGLTHIFVQDATAGIGVLCRDGMRRFHFAAGDSVTIMGRVGQATGTTVLDSIVTALTVTHGVAHTPQPATRTVAQIVNAWDATTRTEPDESRLVRLAHLHLLAGTWPTARLALPDTLLIGDDTGAVHLLIDRDSPLNGSPQPPDPFSVTALVTQGDISVPLTADYVLIPRVVSDIGAGNLAPAVQSLADVSLDEASTLVVTPSASDGDGDALTWSGASLPVGAWVDPATGVLTWETAYADAGTYPGVTLTATDAYGGSASASFTITVANVNRPPAVSAIPDHLALPGAQLTIEPQGSDADGDVLTWTGAHLPDGAALDAATGVLTWTPDAAQFGPHPGITLTATDPAGASASASFGLTVVGQTSVDDIVPLVPEAFALEGIAPNPARGTIACRVAAPRAMRVQGDIVDARGRVVRQLASRDLPAGITTVSVALRDAQGRALAPGRYLLRLRDGQRTVARPVTVVR